MTTSRYQGKRRRPLSKKKILGEALIFGLVCTLFMPGSASTSSPALASSNCAQTTTTNSGLGNVAVIESGNYCYVAFKNTGSVGTQTNFSWTKPAGVSSADIFVVAGGGGGGSRHQGGGGAGGVIVASATSLVNIDSLTVVVGAGGAGGVPQGGTSASSGSSGQGSSVQKASGSGLFTALNAVAGSGGSLGVVGGSGGGGYDQQRNGGAFGGGWGTTGQGYGGGLGGYNSTTWYAGGGGGAGFEEMGRDGTANGGGAGGAGKIWTADFNSTIATNLGLVDTSGYFGGGGGGGITASTGSKSGGAGGLGGGGAGGGTGAGLGPSGATGVDATPYTGGGGGGSGLQQGQANVKGGDGGSGIVILRYSLNCKDSFSPSSGTGVGHSAFVDGYCVVAFKNTGSINTQTTFSWTPPSGIDLVDVLVIGGGGGGGAHVGAGGGAGGFIEQTNVTVNAPIQIIVGQGGRRSETEQVSGFGNGDVPIADRQKWGRSGESSSFGTITAAGGGRGGFWYNYSGNGQPYAGGSGGGGVADFAGTGNGSQTLRLGQAGNTPSTSPSQGNSGGNGSSGYFTGGGGGAGSAGANASSSKAGDGGAGRATTWLTATASAILQVGEVSGASVYFSGGGGGGYHDVNANNPKGNGGVGGGGDGNGPTSSTSVVYAQDGAANTGGGGGGSGRPAGTAYQSFGGYGGSGVVVIRYATAGQAPSAPTNFELTSGANSVGLSWTAPASSVGSAISNYLLEYKIRGGEWTSVSRGSSTSTSATISGLTANSIYSFRVRAVNASGSGAWSDVRAVFTAPGMISFLDASEPSSYSGSGTTWTDLTGKSNGVTSIGSPTFDNTNKSFNLNGTNQYFSYGANKFAFGGSPGNPPYTLNVLFSPDTPDSSYEVLLSRHDGGVQGSYYLAFIDDGNGAVLYGEREAAPWEVKGTTALSANTKYLATYVYDGTNVLLYLNGQLQNSRAIGAIWNQDLETLLGAKLYLGAATNFFDGKLYAASIFNTALDATQVLGLAQALDTAPSAPTIDSITASTQQLSVAFTAGTNSGTAIQKYQYSTDGGATWRDRASGTTASPLVITTTSDTNTSLAMGTSYNVQIRAVNLISGTASATTVGTTLGTYAISYNSNNATGGSAPSNQTKVHGTNLTLASNSGNLVRTGYTFAGWNTQADGNGTDYAEGATYSLNVADELFAKWITTLAITTPSSGLSAIVGQLYTLNISVSGGDGTKSYSATGLPNGLSINSSDGTISGTPTATGNSTVAVTVTDPTGSKTTNNFTISVAQIPLGNASNPTVAATANTLKSISVSWTAVTNASSYTIKLYAADGTSLLATITGASGTSRTINASDYAPIADNTEYKVSIQAIGTGSYSSSDESGKVSVTTLAQRTITFDSNGGSSVSPISVNPGSATSKPTNPTKDGLRFGGWSTSETSNQGDLSNRIRVWPYTPANSLTLYAIWVDDYSLQLLGNQRVSARVGTDANRVPVIPNDSSFSWEAWIYPTGVSGTGSTKYATVLDNLDSGNNYGRTWLYVMDSGAGPYISAAYYSSSTPEEGRAAATDANSISYNKWHHVAVTIERSGGAEGSCVNTGALTVRVYIDGVLKRESIDSAFSRCLDSIGFAIGDNFDDANQQFKGKIDQVKVWNGVLTLAEVQSSMASYGTGSVDNTLRAHYTFDELPTSPVSGNYLKNQASDAGTYDLQLFSATPADVTNNASRSLNSFTISYDGNSATAGSVTSVTDLRPFSTTSLANQGNLLRTGYSFGGWNLNAQSTGTSYDAGASYVVSYGDQTLFANWSANTYTISFNANGATGGSAPGNQSKIHGTDLTLATNSGNLVRTGYTFAGWSTQADGGGTQYEAGGTYTLNEGDELFARWTGNQYVFNGNTASGSTSALTFAGSILTAPASSFTAPTGYAFAGWCSAALATVSASCTGTTYAQGANLPTPASSTVTLYAIWTSTLAITTPTSGLSVTVGQSYTLNISVSGGTGTRTYSATGLANGLSIDSSSGVISGTPTTAGNLSVTVTVSDSTGTKTTNSFTIAIAQILLADVGDPTVTATAGTLKSISVSWVAVSNASSYTLKIYAANGTTLLQTLTGLSGTSKTITASDYSAIADNTTYQISIQAIGNGNFTSSNESGKISVTTLVTYTVTYDYNSATGGAAVTQGTYIPGGPELTLPVPTKTGYTFAGWYETAGFSGSALASTITTASSKTIFAKWTAATFTVLYQYNGATGGNTTESSTYTTGSSAITPPTPTRTGYNFDGWFESSSFAGNAVSSSYVTSQNRTLFAKWTPINYTVTYNATNVVGGTTINPTSGSVPVNNNTFNIGQSFSLAANTGLLARNGYTFAGWVTNADGTGTARNSGETITFEAANINLYPKWAANTYTISYNLNGGSGSLTGAPTSWTVGNSNVTLPSSGFTRTGYDFAGWAQTQNGAVVSNSFSNIGDVTLYAVWNLKSISYAFDKGTANGATISNGTWPSNSAANFGSTITLPNLSGATATISGVSYLFFGWELNGTTYQSGNSYTLGESSPTFTAEWVRLFDVRYGYAGGTHSVAGDTDDECVTAGLCINNQSITLRSAPSRTGYTFNGWRIQDTNTNKAAGATHTVIATEYLFYASWTAVNYVFSFNSMGGSDSHSSVTSNIGQLVTMPHPGVKPGYSFAGWSPDGGTTKYSVGSTFVVGSESKSFIAQWTPNVYTVVFDWQGASGTPTPDASYTVGTGVLALPLIGDRTKDGFTFGGWSETAGGTFAVSNFVPSGNDVLYAIWNDGNYTLSYNGQGASAGSGSGNVGRGQSITLPTPIREGFVFNGWYDAETGGNKIGNGGQTYTPNRSKTMHARWVQKSLWGVDLATLEDGPEYVASDNTEVDTLLTHVPTNTSARVRVPAGALPNGTKVKVQYFKDTNRQSALIPGDNSYFFSVLVSWLSGSGSSATVPNTNAGKPIEVTLNNNQIKAGAMVYMVIGDQVTELGRATQDGTVTVELTEDPEIVVAATAPGSPVSVLATAGDQEATVSWAAPSTNGGSPIVGYRVTASPGGASCTTTATTCTITGLTNGTSYVFSAVTLNNVGESSAVNTSGIIPNGANVVQVSPESGIGQTPNIIGKAPQLPTQSVWQSGPSGSISSSGERILFESDVRRQTLSAKSSTWKVELAPPLRSRLDTPISNKLEIAAPFRGKTSLTASGLLPGSTIEVFAFSSPQYLGSVKVGLDGKLKTALNLPRSVLPGKHTLALVTLDSFGRKIELFYPIKVEGLVSARISGDKVLFIAKQVLDRDIKLVINGKRVSGTRWTKLRSGALRRIVAADVRKIVKVEIYIGGKLYRNLSLRPKPQS